MAAIDAGSIFSDIRIRLDKMDKDLDQAYKRVDTLVKQNEVLAAKVEESWKDSFNVMSAAAVAAFAMISNEVRKSIQLFTTFEQSLANISSLTNATASDFDLLRNAAIEMGEQTRYTAAESANALYLLAQAGMTATEAVDALNGVLLLAGSTQSDMASSAKLVSNTLAQFKLDASEATRLSNLFAASIPEVRASMDKLTDSLRYAGPVAESLGWSIEETVASLGALFKAGYEGRMAGTALRAVLSTLANQADAGTKKLIAMGAEYSRLNPQINQFADIVDYLNDMMLEAGDVLDIFGERAGPQMLTLLSAGGDALRDYESALTGTSRATEMYRKQNETLEGAYYRLKSAIESLKISISDEFAPTITDLVEALTKTVLAVNKLPGPFKTFFSILLIGTPAIMAATKAYQMLSAAMLSSMGPIGWVTLGVAGVAAGLNAINTASRNAKIRELEDEFGDLGDKVSYSDRELVKIAKTADITGIEFNALLDYLTGKGLSLDFLDDLANAIQVLKLEESDASIAALELGRSYGMTTTEVMELMLASDKLTGSQRRSLRIQVDLAKGEKARRDALMASQNAFIEARDAADAYTDDQIKQSQEIANALFASQKVISDYLRMGVIDRKQAIDDEIDAWNDYIDAIYLLDPAVINVEGAVAAAVAQIKKLRDESDGLTEAEKKAKEETLALERAIAAADDRFKQFGDDLRLAGKKGMDLLKVQREIAIEAENASEATDEQKEKNIDAINSLYDAYEELQKIQDDETAAKKLKEAEGAAQSYQWRLESLGATSRELIEIQRKQALAALDAAEYTAEEFELAKAAVDEFYDALVQQDKWQGLVGAVDQGLGALRGLLQSAGSIASTIHDRRIKEINDELYRELEARGILEQTQVERLAEELAELDEKSEASEAEIQERIDAARRAGRAIAALQEQEKLDALRADNEKTRSAKSSALERAKLEEEYEKKRIQAKYKADLAAWGINLSMAMASAAQATLSGYATQPFLPVGLAAGTLALGLGAAQVAAVSVAKPEPPKLATGGIFLPRAGGHYVNMAENGYGELALNAGPSGAELLGQFADAIAARITPSENRSQPVVVNWQIDGKTISSVTVDDINNGRQRLNRGAKPRGWN